jgi:hypothetical protein
MNANPRGYLPMRLAASHKLHERHLRAFMVGALNEPASKNKSNEGDENDA